MLFIDSRDIPENYQEAFGFATVLVPFDASAPNMSWSMVSSLNVPCLPYRMRAQGNRVYYDKGLNALRNFVNGPKGDIDPELKMKFKPDKAKGKKKGG